MGKKIPVIILSLIFIQGCADNASISRLELSSRDSSCVEKVLLNKASIKGKSSVKKGELTTYSIVDDYKDCSKTNSVAWDTNDGFKNDESNDSSFKHAYRNAGEYELEATLVSSDGSILNLSKGIVVEQPCLTGAVCLRLKGPLVSKINQEVRFVLKGVEDVENEISWSSKNERGETSNQSTGIFTFESPGKFLITANLEGTDYTKLLTVTAPDVVADPKCNLEEILLSGPSELHLNEVSDVHVNLPECVSSEITGITWSFSDGQKLKFGQETKISFEKSGDQKYTVKITLKSEGSISLSREVSVSKEECVDCGSEGDSENNDGEEGGSPSGEPNDEPNDEPIDIIIDGPDNLDCGAVKNGTEIFIKSIITGGAISCGEGFGSKIITNSAKKIKTCTNGVYVDSVKPAEVISETACFKWNKTDVTTCTKSCGGVQHDLFTCSSSLGEVRLGSDSGLCGAAPEVEAYACDGDPNFEEIRITETMEKGKPRVCNSNRRGYVIDKETTQEIYRCVDHEVRLVDTIKILEEAPFCLDLKRCSGDSLSPSKAHGRLQWMKKCSGNEKIEKFFSITKNFKYAPQNSYVFNEKRKRIEGRPTYATFRSKKGSLWRAPAPGTRNWRTRVVDSGNDVSKFSCDIPDDVEIVGICMSSCVTPVQRILASFGEVKMIDAHRTSLSEVVTLSPLSTIFRPVLSTSPVLQFITEVTNSKHDILVFNMASGKTIEYTPNHPVVTKEGKLKEAGNFIVGEHFVRKSGELDEVLKIISVKHFGKVYNVFMETSVPERNVVVINDYLTGSAYFQNEGHDYVDRKILRSLLVE